MCSCQEIRRDLLTQDYLLGVQLRVLSEGLDGERPVLVSEVRKVADGVNLGGRCDAEVLLDSLHGLWRGSR